MIYLRVFVISFLISMFFSTPLFIAYNSISYLNIIYILIPLLFCIVTYLFFKDAIKRRVNINLIPITQNFLISAIFLSAAVIITILHSNFKDIVEGNFVEVRGEFVDRNVGILEQLVPLLQIYPLIHLLVMLSQKKQTDISKILIIISGLLVIGLAAGGRQIIFMLMVLVISLRGSHLFKRKIHTFIALSTFVFFASFVTIGRYSEIDKVRLLESILPGNINTILTKESNFGNAQQIAIEVGFYFGHQIPAFCNKMNNLELTILPNYYWGMQPFIERQLYRFNLLNYSQEIRYNRLLDLSEGSGFFKASWSTGFLDVYFNLGLLGSIFFFLVITILFFITEQNIPVYNMKYRIIRAFNILFIITMFMTPAFFDTTIFFSYVFVLFSDIKD